MRKRKNYLRMYRHILRIVKNNIDAYQKDETDRTALKRLVLWTGRELVYEQEHKEDYETENLFAVSELYKSLVSGLTYREFMEIYPIDKRYDGARWGTRDYFSTMEFLSDIDLDSKIGGEKQVMDLFFEYDNWELLDVASASMCAMSAMSRKLLGVDPAVAFLTKEENYAHDSKGNIVGVTADGRTHKVPSFWNNKKYQSHLSVVK